MKIYTETEFEEGLFPRKEDFPRALKELKKDYDCGSCEGVWGVMFFGSVVKETSSLASDIDCFVVLRDPDYIVTIRDFHENSYQRYGVGVDSTIITLDDAKSGEHGIKLDFYNSLVVNKNFHGFVGEDPLTVMEFKKKDVRKAVRSTLKYHERKLLTRYANNINEREKIVLLESILAKPFQCMRKLIQFDLKGPIQKDGQYLDSYEEIRDLFYDIYAPKNKELAHDVLVAVELIKNQCQNYKQLLEKRVEADECNDILRIEWQEMMQGIFFSYGKALNVVRDCKELIN